MLSGRTSDCWAILGIEPTTDARAILKAYAKSLKACRPDDDPEGFQRLVEAREEAMWIAGREAATPVRDTSEATSSSHRGDAEGEVDEPVEPVAPNFADAFPGNTVPIETEEAAELSAEHGLLGEVLEKLNALLPDTGGPAGQEAKGEDWAALFAMASELDLESLRRFHNIILRNLWQILPPPDPRGLGDIAAFEQGEGPAALAELIERECQFNWSGAELLQLAGNQGAQFYLYWLSQAQAARQLIERRANVAYTYGNSQDGLPGLLAEDAAVLLSNRRTKATYDKGRAKSRWRFSFEPRCLFVPVDILCVHGLSWPAFALSAFSLLLSGLLLSIPPTDLHTFFGGLALFVGLRVGAGFFIRRCHLNQLSKWVKEADRRGLLGQTRQAFLAAASRVHRFTGAALVADFLSMILIIVGVLAILPATFNQDLLHMSADEALDGLELSIFQKAASDDDFSDQDFADLSARLATARAAVPRDGASKEAKLNVGFGFNDVVRVRSRLNSNVSDVDRRIAPLASRVERERKLRRIAAAYQAATPEQRRQIESVLVEWSKLLSSAKGSARLNATIWALIPPRERQEPSTIDLAPEARRLIISLFIEKSLRDPEGTADFSQAPAALNALLNMPDEDLLQSISPSDPISVAGTNIWISTSSAPETINDNPSLVIEWPKAASDNPVWNEAATDWRFFAGVAKVCLNDARTSPLKALLVQMAAASAKAADMGGNVPDDYWARAGAQLFDIEDCRRSYVRKMNPKADFKLEARQEANSKFQNALGSGDLAEAARIIGFAKEMSSDSPTLDSDIVRQFEMRMASQSLLKGDIITAVEYSDASLPWLPGCQTRAVRGFILSALGEKQRALAELSLALKASDQQQLCGEQEIPFVDLQRIKSAVSLMENSATQ